MWCVSCEQYWTWYGLDRIGRKCCPKCRQPFIGQDPVGYGPGRQVISTQPLGVKAPLDVMVQE